jgi:hypothetical protein
MLLIHAFTAHFQTSLSQKIIKINGNAIAIAHTDLFLTLMVQRHVNYDLPFIDYISKFLDNVQDKLFCQIDRYDILRYIID